MALCLSYVLSTHYVATRAASGIQSFAPRPPHPADGEAEEGGLKMGIESCGFRLILRSKEAPRPRRNPTLDFTQRYDILFTDKFIY